MSDSVASQTGLCIPLSTVHIDLPGGTEQGLLERFKFSMSAAQLFPSNIDLPEKRSCGLSLLLPQRPAHTFWRVLPGSYSTGVKHLQVLKKEFKAWCWESAWLLKITNLFASQWFQFFAFSQSEEIQVIEESSYSRSQVISSDRWSTDHCRIQKYVKKWVTSH